MTPTENSRGSELLVLGLMTGTSCDGLDAACISITRDGWAPIWEASAPYPARLKKNVLKIQAPGARVSILELLELDRDLGDWYASSIRKFLARRETPDIIANHGQTVAHFPAPRRRGTTLQLGDPSRICEITGITTISHFREGDMASGGQGAPLVPVFHKLLAHSLREGMKSGDVAIHNIGGISNLTFVSRKNRNEKMLAFDTGPGNVWIDAAAEKITRGKQKMDRGGLLASRGKIDVAAVNALLRHPYFSKPPPKSTGRDEFPFELFLSKTRATGPSLVATATAVTVESIARAYEKWILGSSPVTVYLCGGGVRNITMIEWLRTRLPTVRFHDLGEVGLDSRYIEAQAFAVLGLMSLLGRPLGGEWTGSSTFGPPGFITPGKNWEGVTQKAARLNLFLS